MTPKKIEPMPLTAESLGAGVVPAGRLAKVDIAELEPNRLDVYAIAMRGQVSGRRFYNTDNEQAQLTAILPRLPDDGEIYKIIGGRDGFSHLELIRYIATREPIKELLITTFRCGPRQMQELAEMHDAGMIDYAEIIVSRMARTERTYFADCSEIAKKIGWYFGWAENHSKITLAKTARNFYAIEASANLNDNPRLEQYSLENSREVYEFFAELIHALRDIGREDVETEHGAG